MPGPTLTFAFIVATLFGAVFHLVVGGTVRKLALYLLCAWIGFGVGHVTGIILGITILNIGTLRIVSASVGALTALIAVHVLTANRARKRPSR